MSKNKNIYPLKLQKSQSYYFFYISDQCGTVFIFVVVRIQ